MGLGYGGCLTCVLALFVMVGGTVWGTFRALQDPGIATVASTQEDAARAQRKLFRLMTGATRDPVVLSEVEVNALVSQNVDARELPFDHPGVFLRSDNVVELVGRTPIQRLLAESSLPLVADLLPWRWSTRPLWLHLEAHAEFEREPRPQLRLDVRRVTLGRQWVPAAALRLFFEPVSLRLVRVPLPDGVAAVRIETGRAVIRPTSSRERI